jgi:DNA-binding NarL/FixJ family response regulator
MDNLADCELDQAATVLNVSAGNGAIRSIAVVDPQTFSRDYLTQLLSGSASKGLLVSAFSTIEEMQTEPTTTFELIIFCTHHRTGQLVDLLLSTVGIPLCPVLVISDQPISELALLSRKILKAGISGILSTVDSHFETVRTAVPFVMNGGVLLPRDLYSAQPTQAYENRPNGAKSGRLTQRQREVFALMQKGKPNKIISYELGLSTSTIKVHVRAIMASLGATNRTEAVVKGEQIDRDYM